MYSGNIKSRMSTGSYGRNILYSGVLSKLFNLKALGLIQKKIRVIIMGSKIYTL